MEIVFKTKKGQAAITDALFTLLIISSLCLMLYSFAATYGNDILSHFLRQYTMDYTIDSLRTFLYGSSARQYDLNLTDDGAIADYTLVLLKEAYFETKQEQQLTEDFNNRVKTFAKTIQTIMQPIADQFDYMLVFTSAPQEGVYENYLAILRKAEFVCHKNNQKADCKQADRNVSIETGKYKFYACTNANDENLRKFMLYIGDSATATSPVLLPISSRDIGFGFITLIVWPSTLITQEMLDNMRCSEIDFG